MNLVAAGMILFVLPLMVTAATAYLFPASWRVYPAMAAFFLSSIVAVSIAAEHYHGRIKRPSDLATAIIAGSKSFAWWFAAVATVIGAALLAVSLN